MDLTIDPRLTSSRFTKKMTLAFAGIPWPEPITDDLEYEKLIDGLVVKAKSLPKEETKPDTEKVKLLIKTFFEEISYQSLPGPFAPDGCVSEMRQKSSNYRFAAKCFDELPGGCTLDEIRKKLVQTIVLLKKSGEFAASECKTLLEIFSVSRDELAFNRNDYFS